MRIAYCRNCETVIAASDDLPSDPLPYHTVDGKRRDDVGLLDVGNQTMPTENVGKWLATLEKKFKNRFK